MWAHTAALSFLTDNVRPRTLPVMTDQVTRGRLALAEWQAADRAARTRAAIARSLGCAHTTVMRWLDGTSRPDAEQRVRLHALTGIAPDAWRTTEERAATVEPLALADTLPPGAA